MNDSLQAAPAAKTQVATFANGCFWGIQDEFDKTPGVIATTVGYTGGKLASPSYEAVCSGTTGHTEAVEVIFDPSRVSFQNLLQTFWKIRTPATANNYHGGQYRSEIFFHSPEQESQAKSAREALSKKLGHAVATEISPAQTFYKAEEYHQKYHQKHNIKSCGAALAD